MVLFRFSVHPPSGARGVPKRPGRLLLNLKESVLPWSILRLCRHILSTLMIVSRCVMRRLTQLGLFSGENGGFHTHGNQQFARNTLHGNQR